MTRPALALLTLAAANTVSAQDLAADSGIPRARAAPSAGTTTASAQERAAGTFSPEPSAGTTAGSTQQRAADSLSARASSRAEPSAGTTTRSAQKREPDSFSGRARTRAAPSAGTAIVSAQQHAADSFSARARTRTAPSVGSAQERAADSFSARASSRAAPSAGTATLSAREAREQPGALGDASRALENLPGVARASFDSGALIIWGSSDTETRVYLDGVELPLLFHPGGFRSSLPEGFVSQLHVEKGAPGPQLGRNLGASVQIETTALEAMEAAPHASLALSTLDTSGSLQGSIGPLRVAWSGRLGYMDRLASLIAPQATENLPVPEYADGFAKAQLALDSRTQLRAAWLGAHDAYQRGQISADVLESRSQTQRRDLNIVYLQYEHRDASLSRVLVTPFVETFANQQLQSSAGIPFQLSARSLRYGMRASYRAELNRFAVQLGFDGAAVRTTLQRDGTLTLPTREGDISVFGQAPGSELSSDNWTTHDANLAPYASLELRLGRLSITPACASPCSCCRMNAPCRAP